MTQLLFIAHPGHELLVLGQFASAAFRVMILTDGSGGAGRSRTELSRELVTRLGGEIGEPFGRYTDGQMYAAILAADAELFGGLVDELAVELMDPAVDALISDAVEHYNPMHDLCSVVAALAVRRAAAWGRPVRHLTSPMLLHGEGPSVVARNVSPAVAAQKRSATLRMEGLIGDLPNIVGARPDVFDREVLIAAEAEAELLPRPQGPVFYETYGRRQLAGRGGGELITYAGHVRPLVQALERREATFVAAAMDSAPLLPAR